MKRCWPGDGYRKRGFSLYKTARKLVLRLVYTANGLGPPTVSGSIIDPPPSAGILCLPDALALLFRRPAVCFSISLFCGLSLH